MLDHLEVQVEERMDVRPIATCVSADKAWTPHGSYQVEKTFECQISAFAVAFSPGTTWVARKRSD